MIARAAENQNDSFLGTPGIYPWGGSATTACAAYTASTISNVTATL